MSKSPGVTRRTVLPSLETMYKCRQPSRSLSQVKDLPPSSHFKSSLGSSQASSCISKNKLRGAIVNIAQITRVPVLQPINVLNNDLFRIVSPIHFGHVVLPRVALEFDPHRCRRLNVDHAYSGCRVCCTDLGVLQWYWLSNRHRQCSSSCKTCRRPRYRTASSTVASSRGST